MFSGAEGVSMSMCADCWLLWMLSLLHLCEGTAATKCSSCSTRMIAARLVGEGSANCCATVGLHEFISV